MRHINCPSELQQNALFDTATLDACSWWVTDLTDSARRHLEENWQGVFRRSLLSLMPAADLGKHFSPDFGRPSKELYSMAALVFIMEFKNWTIDAAAEAYIFDAGLQFALNLSNRGNYLCPRSLDHYRQLIRTDKTAAAVFAHVTDTLVRELNLRISRQRLDSTHVLSDMASFGRTKLLAVGIKRFLTSLKRHAFTEHEALPTELRQRYESSVAKLFGEAAHSRETRAAAQLQSAQDMHLLIERFADQAAIAKRSSYTALVRLFEEHCEIKAKRIRVRDKARDSQGGSANTLQNPSDFDAGYSGHKGPGHQVQLIETSHSDNPVQLVLDCLPQSAAESDSAAPEQLIENLRRRQLLPDELAADTAYGSDENHQLAQRHGIDLISPTPGAPPKNGHSGELAKETAPAPAAGTKRRPGRPPRGKLSEKNQARHEKAKRMAARRERESSEEWREKYRVRAGIESLNRALDRRTGLKRLRVRGKEAVAHSTYGKVMGWNILQAARAIAQAGRKARKEAREVCAALETIMEAFVAAITTLWLCITSTLHHAGSPRHHAPAYGGPP